MVIEINNEQTLHYMRSWVPMIRELLVAKGFPLNRDDILEKISLLHTEVAELTDDYKKGKGKEAEGLEIADILIRLMNIPVCFPLVFDEIVDLSSVKLSNFFSGVRKETICTYIESWKNPYEATTCIHEEVAELGETCATYLQRNEDPFLLLRIIQKLQIIITLCSMYNTQYLNKYTLDGLTDLKMKVNWNRPYRYNTDPKLFSN